MVNSTTLISEAPAGDHSSSNDASPDSRGFTLHPRYSLQRVGIYVAQLNDYGPFRIAWSRDVPMRIKRIQADCPSGDVRLLAMCPATKMNQELLAKLLPYSHPYGKDWYRYCHEVLRIVAEL